MPPKLGFENETANISPSLLFGLKDGKFLGDIARANVKKQVAFAQHIGIRHLFFPIRSF